MTALKLAIAGCGVMGRRHVLGLGKLRGVDRLRFELAAAIDPVAASAEALADIAEAQLGVRPRTFADLASMQAAMSVDALDITTSPDLHTPVGVAALEAGIHVMVEKPIALTVAQGLVMIDAARRHGRVLSVAENYRRDPINRLAKALIDAGAIGRPYLAVQSSSGSGENVIITPWRHLKGHCGIAIDMGVHYADILEYLLGPIEALAGMGAVVDTERKGQDGTVYPADAEDLAVGVLRFNSGVIANLLLDLAGRGAGSFERMVYGTRGTLSIPTDRTGKPLELIIRRDGKPESVSTEEMLAIVPGFAVDATTAALFGGERLGSYDLGWADIDANLLAIEYDDFAEAIINGIEPEVTGEMGLRSLAISYGLLESERLGRVMPVAELMTGETNPYQDEVEAIARGQRGA